MLSFWHVHARDYARQATEHPDTEIVAVWDEIVDRGKAEAERLSVSFYDSIDELLSLNDIDGVIVDVPTNMHGEVMIKAALAKKHIFTEKVLALTLREANQIVSSVKEANVKLIVSLPRINDSYTLAIQEILSQGLLGDLTYARVRLAHNGAIANWLPEHFYSLSQCGGGALTDLGCHPMYLTRLFLGMPERISASYGYVLGKEVEDNAVAVLMYSNGALGVVEAGFVTSASPFSIEIHGTRGSVIYGFSQDKVLLKTTLTNINQWTEYPLPAPRPSAFEQWVDHIKKGTSPDDNVALALDLTKLIEAANLSAQYNSPYELHNLDE